MGVSILVLAASCATAAAAQDDFDATEGASGREDVIIVTATRREERLQDVPMSINAFSGERLEKSGIEDIRDVQFLAAGLHVNNQTGLTAITIRGVGNNSFVQGAESGAAVHIDGVYLAQPTELGASYYDVERLEVLRGPQGTLYGRNATGGAVNLITRAPTDTFEAGGSVSLGNYGLVETEGFFSGPLTEEGRWAGRVAFKTRDHEGYTPNIYDGGALDDEDFAGVRGRLSYDSDSAFNLDLSADYARDDGVPTYVYTRGIAGAPLTGELLGSVLPSGRAVNYNNESVNDKELWGASARAAWDFENMTLAALTSYRSNTWRQAIEFDGSDQDLFFVPEGDREAEQVSEEVTLTSAGDGRFQWVLGGFYFYNTESSHFVYELPPISVVVTTDVLELSGSAYAVFGEGSYDLTERLTLTLGARYSFEDKLLDQEVSGVRQTIEDDWSAFTPKIALSYAFSPDLTGYATVGTGFKSGGFNTGTIQESTVDAEEVTNYEAGLRGVFFDGGLQASVSAFRMDYTDLQVLVQRTNPDTMAPYTILANAASSQIDGVELEFQARPTESLAFDGAVSWLDARFDEWTDAVDVLRGGAAFDASGNQMLNAPEWAANLGATYTVPVGDWGEASVRGEYAYKDRVYFDPFESGFLSQGAYSTYNLRVALDENDGRWSLAAWGRNLSDEQIATRMFASASALTGSPRGVTYLAPRTYGVTLGYRF